MPKSRIMIQLDKEFIKQIDGERGDVPRAAWIRRVLEERMDGAGRIQAEAREATAAAIRNIREAQPATDEDLAEIRKEMEPQREYVCENCGNLWPLEDKNRLGGLCGPCFDERPASVAQAEPSAPNRGDAGSTPARRAGEGGRPRVAQRQSGPQGDDDAGSNPAPRRSPSRKPKACKHTNQIRKLGRPYCTDCGEFV